MHKMITKKGKVSARGTISWSYRNLHKVEEAIEKIENSNFIKRFFCKDSLQTLKEQKEFIERTIKREREFVAFKELSKMHSSEVPNIIKENKALTKQITRGKMTGYISKREENHNKKAEQKPLITKVLLKPTEIANPYQSKAIWLGKMKSNITFTKVEKKKVGRPKGKPRKPVLAKDLI